MTQEKTRKDYAELLFEDLPWEYIQDVIRDNYMLQIYMLQMREIGFFDPQLRYWMPRKQVPLETYVDICNAIKNLLNDGEYPRGRVN